LATFAFFNGETVAARHHAREWVQQARSTNDPYELSQALTMLGAALWSPSSEVREDVDAPAGAPTGEAIAVLDEAVRVARDAHIPSALSVALAALTGSLAPHEDERVRALLDEAIEVAGTVADRLAAAAAYGMKAGLEARRADWWASLQAVRLGAEHLDQLGYPMVAGPACDQAAWALAALGHPEPAAVLRGASQRFAPGGPPDWAVELGTRCDAKLVGDLGDHRLASLKTQGASLSATDALAYLRAAAEHALAE
jgi:hypothetical protein